MNCSKWRYRYKNWLLLINLEIREISKYIKNGGFDASYFNRMDKKQGFSIAQENILNILWQTIMEINVWKVYICVCVCVCVCVCMYQFSSVTQSCPTLCDPMNHSTPGLSVYHQLPESTWVGDAIQPSHPLSSPSPPALNLSQYQDLFKWVSSLHHWPK